MYYLYSARDRNDVLAERWDESLSLQGQMRHIVEECNTLNYKIVSVFPLKDGSVSFIVEGY